MTKFCLQISVVFILFLTINAVFAQSPTFNMTVRNIKTTNTFYQETGDTLTFEVWLRWTNYGASDRFEFAAAQYVWLCNRAILNSLPGLKLDRLPGDSANPLPPAYRPPTFQIDSVTSPPGQLYLKTTANPPNSETPAFIVSANAPYGSKLLTFRLVNLSQQNFPLVSLNLRFKLGSPPNTFAAYFQPFTGSDTENSPPQQVVVLNDTVVNHYSVESSNYIVGSKIKVNLTALIEGKYNSAFNLMTKRDTVIVYLRNAAAPFEIIDSARGVLDSVNFSNVFTFNKAENGYYYIVIKHYQSIETWSRSGGEYLIRDSSSNNYDFTTSASQAYYDNLKYKGSKYCLYGGDVDQNGSINLTDALLIYNDAADFVQGYSVNDLTGDNLVDLNDLLIASANKNGFIRVRTP